MDAAIVENPPVHLWIDSPHAMSHIAGLLQNGVISVAEAELLTRFREDGLVIFPGVFSADEIEDVCEELRNLHLDGKKYLLRMPKGEIQHPDRPVNIPKSRLLDYYVNSELARNMVLAPPITRFLQLIYEEPPLAFQSLMFTWGTEHSIHVDNTYIVADPPCTLMASWIALQDIVPGSGELAYYPGSHRHPLYLFKGTRIEWRHQEDRKMAHLDYTRFLRERADSIDGDALLFHPQKGDVMIWHSNLVHYGTHVTKPEHTRKSLLTHYCPAHTARPNYFRFFADACKRSWRDGFYSSRRYDLRPGVDNPYPVYLK
jgi:phytanoyl-CoA hydroxylase